MSTSAASVGRSGYGATGANDRRSMSGLVDSGGIMIHRFLLCIFLFSLVVSLASSAQPEQSSYDGTGESWSWGFGSEEGGGGSSSLRSGWENGSSRKSTARRSPWLTRTLPPERPACASMTSS